MVWRHLLLLLFFEEFGHKMIDAVAPLPCTNAMIRHGASISATPSCSGNQVADLVFTLAQQISHKDAHIERMRSAMRKGDVRAERACRELEREVERKTLELVRVRKRLRVYETELQVAQRVNEQLQQNVTNSNTTTKNESALAKLEQLMAENADLRAKLTRQAQLDIEHDMEADQQRQEVRSLRAKLEQVQEDLQRREAHAADMQAELERAVVEREMARMELAASEHHNGKKDHQHHHGISMPMSSLESSLVDDGHGEGGPSLASSSGISTNLSSSDTKACRKLRECRAKVCHLVRMAEKAQSGQRLGREDLFGCGASDTASTSCHFDEHVKKLRREVELLHDKFIILYARGAIGRWE